MAGNLKNFHEKILQSPGNFKPYTNNTISYKLNVKEHGLWLKMRHNSIEA